jgi:hypothetical protein
VSKIFNPELRIAMRFVPVLYQASIHHLIQFSIAKCQDPVHNPALPELPQGGRIYPVQSLSRQTSGVERNRVTIVEAVLAEHEQELQELLDFQKLPFNRVLERNILE